VGDENVPELELFRRHDVSTGFRRGRVEDAAPRVTSSQPGNNSTDSPSPVVRHHADFAPDLKSFAREPAVDDASSTSGVRPSSARAREFIFFADWPFLPTRPDAFGNAGALAAAR